MKGSYNSLLRHHLSFISAPEQRINVSVSTTPDVYTNAQLPFQSPTKPLSRPYQHPQQIGNPTPPNSYRSSCKLPLLSSSFLTHTRA